MDWINMDLHVEMMMDESNEELWQNDRQANDQT
jgi:hypothetical protein